MHLWTDNIILVSELVWEDLEGINGIWKLSDSYYWGFMYIYVCVCVCVCVWNVNSLERNDDKASAKSMGKEAEI